MATTCVIESDLARQISIGKRLRDGDSEHSEDGGEVHAGFRLTLMTESIDCMLSIRYEISR
jgi:hypothetical protein